MATHSTSPSSQLDLSRSFLPGGLSGTLVARPLEGGDARLLNQIRGAAYLHLFDVFETSLAEAVRERALSELDARESLEPLLRFDAFDHGALFRTFLTELEAVFPVPIHFAGHRDELVSTFGALSPLALLVLALHFKLVTQQHYLACVRGDDLLEPHFVRVLRDHWGLECGTERTSGTAMAIQRALSRALPGRVPAAMRDYRLAVFACDDLLTRQASLDVETLEQARGARLSPADAVLVREADASALRKTFLTVGIVNAAFVYAMRSLGPTAPASLAGVVAALSARHDGSAEAR